MFFELPQYHIKDGQRDRWAKLMEARIIPYQKSKDRIGIGNCVGRVEEHLL